MLSAENAMHNNKRRVRPREHAGRHIKPAPGRLYLLYLSKRATFTRVLSVARTKTSRCARKRKAQARHLEPTSVWRTCTVTPCVIFPSDDRTAIENDSPKLSMLVPILCLGMVLWYTSCAKLVWYSALSYFMELVRKKTIQNSKSRVEVF